MNAIFRAVGARARSATLVLVAVGLAACGGVQLVNPNGPGLAVGQPVQVALLVPSGSGQAGDETLAISLENAARLAISDLSGVEVDLQVYQTAGDPERAASAAAEAVGSGATIILGPVYAASANAVGSVVAARGVNVLSFSNNTDIAGGNVFVLGNTFENTASRLVSYARAQGRSQVTIAYGQDTAETKGRDAIATSLALAGATFAGETSFELSQSGVVQAATEVRETVNNSGSNAIFFTSGTAGALPILSQLLIENGLDREAVQFIGLQRWDIPPSALELPGLQGGWFAVPSPGLAEQFSARYQAAYGQPPHPIAGLAYDGIAAIGALVSAGTPDALSAASLTQPTGFAGVNGAFRLLPNGTNERGLAVATIIDQQVSILDPAPRSFTGPGF
ncbi:MAG: penicillin-binding protein activator [Pseudomonadota bacterium]